MFSNQAKKRKELEKELQNRMKCQEKKHVQGNKDGKEKIQKEERSRDSKRTQCEFK